VSERRPPRELLPPVDPRTWRPDEKLLNAALGFAPREKPDEKRDRRKDH
jgi:hypothetical protein